MRERVLVARPPEAVWAYTQDWTRRREWDAAILKVEILSSGPERAVRFRTRGMRAVARYRADHPPARTSLALEDVRSWFVSGGGGSWSYEAEDGGTRWTQVNTLTFRTAVARWVLGRAVERNLLASTRRSMARAKAILEAEGGPSEAKN